MTAPKSSFEFEFNFDMDAYAFISIAMMKTDKNLSETRERLVPNEVEDDEFWRNYFYHIECAKAELGIPNRLGEKIPEEERVRMIEEEVKRLEEPVVLNEEIRTQQVAAEEGDSE